VKLLIDIGAQYRGDNNGDLTTAWSVKKERGWKSRDTLSRAQKELEAGGWISRTRQGGRNMPTLWALSFCAIDECKGKLDVASTTVPSNAWRKSDSLTRNPTRVDTDSVSVAVTLHGG
jgi:hypothetical protein